MFQIILFLHVMGAILAFGPTYAYSIIGAAGGREPQHANFATRVSDKIGTTLVYPLAIVQGITGVLLILIGNINLFASTWLLIGIVLYVAALAYAFTIQRNAVHRVIELTTMPAGGPPPGAPAGGPPPGAPAGPPPGLREAVRKVQLGGMGLGITIAVIVFLMVTKLSF
jgi:Predicted integral membrane protein (DUF2269)